MELGLSVSLCVEHGPELFLIVAVDFNVALSLVWGTPPPPNKFGPSINAWPGDPPKQIWGGGGGTALRASSLYIGPQGLKLSSL